MIVFKTLYRLFTLMRLKTFFIAIKKSSKNCYRFLLVIELILTFMNIATSILYIFCETVNLK